MVIMVNIYLLNSSLQVLTQWHILCCTAIISPHQFKKDETEKHAEKAAAVQQPPPIRSGSLSGVAPLSLFFSK